MGVDLTLMPLMSKDFWCSHELIQVERRRELWDPIAELPQKPIPRPIACYVARDPKTGDIGYGEATITPYGEPMTFTTTAELLTLKDHEGVQDNWKNRAVWAHLEKMPPDWPIVLWWH